MLDARSRSTARSTASGGLVGSGRGAHVTNTQDAASRVEHAGVSIWYAAADAPAPRSGRWWRNKAGLDEARNEPAERKLLGTPASSSTRFGRLVRDVTGLRPQHDAPPPDNVKTAVERHMALPARIAMVPSRPPGLFRPARVIFTRRRVAAAVGAGLLLAIGVLVFGPSRDPVHLTSPALGALPSEETASTEWAPVLQRAVDESVPAIAFIPSARQLAPPEPEPTVAFPSMAVSNGTTPRDDYAIASKSVQGSIAGGTAAMVIESGATCTFAMLALGLCPAEPGQAQPATPIRPTADLARRPATDHATGGCKEAVAALGLCAQ